jgi:hypothetical protein
VLEQCANLEILNNNKINIGPATKQWIAEHSMTLKSIFRYPNVSGGDDEFVEEDFYLEEQTIAQNLETASIYAVTIQVF